MDLSLLVFPIVSLIPIIIIFTIWYFRNKENTIVRHYEFHESINISAGEEPRPTRDLSKEEQTFFSSSQKYYHKSINNTLQWVIIFLIFSLFFSWFLGELGTMADETSALDYLITNPTLLIAALITGAAIATTIYIYERRKETRFYQDAQTAVWNVRGNLIKGLKRPYDYNLYFTVRNINFKLEPGRDKESLIEIYKKISNYSEVVVEYSPFTKHVWDVKLAKP